MNNYNNKNQINSNSSNESIHLSLILASNIFLQRPNGYDQNIIEKGFLKRTVGENISFRTHSLDLLWDFRIFSIIISKFQRQRDSSFVLYEEEIYKSLKTKKSVLPLDSLCSRLDKLRKSTVNITIGSGDDQDKYDAPLVVDWDRDDVEKCFMLQVAPIFSKFYIKNAQYERIYLDTFKSLKGCYARALYLLLATLKFKHSRSIRLDEKDKLIRRFGTNISGNSSKNIKLVRALESLKNVGVIYEYKRYKSPNNGRSICQIYRDRDSFRADEYVIKNTVVELDKKARLQSAIKKNCEKDRYIKIPEVGTERIDWLDDFIDLP